MRPFRPDAAQQTAAPTSSHQPADQQGDAHEGRGGEPVQVRPRQAGGAEQNGIE